MPRREAGPARRLAVGGALVENVVMQAMEKRLGFVGEPYKEGEAGKYKKWRRPARWAGRRSRGAGPKSRLAAAAGGGLVLAGEVALRWSVFKAGFQSARDPKYTVEPSGLEPRAAAAPHPRLTR